MPDSEYKQADKSRLPQNDPRDALHHANRTHTKVQAYRRSFDGPWQFFSKSRVCDTVPKGSTLIFWRYSNFLIKQCTIGRWKPACQNDVKLFSRCDKHTRTAAANCWISYNAIIGFNKTQYRPTADRQHKTTYEIQATRPTTVVPDV